MMGNLSMIIVIDVQPAQRLVNQLSASQNKTKSRPCVTELIFACARGGVLAIAVMQNMWIVTATQCNLLSNVLKVFGVPAVNFYCFYFQEFRQFEADGTSQRQEDKTESKDCAEFVFMSLMQGR